MSSSEDVINKIYLRLNQDGLKSSSTDRLLQQLLDEVCMSIAANKFYYELVKNIQGTTDSEGKYRLATPALPYIAFIYGTEDHEHTWQRISPVTYDYFIRWKEGTYRGSIGVGGGITGGFLRRYTQIPSGDDDCVLQLLEIRNAVNINLYYYPIKPTPSDFPGYFEPLIIAKTIYEYSLYNRESSGDRFFQILEKDIKKLQKNIDKLATQIEIVSSPNSPYNKKTQDWLANNDLGFWRGI